MARTSTEHTRIGWAIQYRRTGTLVAAGVADQLQLPVGCVAISPALIFAKRGDARAYRAARFAEPAPASPKIVRVKVVARILRKIVEKT